MSGDKQQMLNRLLTRLFFLPSAFKKLNFTQHLVLISPLADKLAINFFVESPKIIS